MVTKVKPNIINWVEVHPQLSGCWLFSVAPVIRCQDRSFGQERVGKELFLQLWIYIYIHNIQSIYPGDLMLLLLPPSQLTRLVCCIIIVSFTAPQNRIALKNSTKENRQKGRHTPIINQSLLDNNSCFFFFFPFKTCIAQALYVIYLVFISLLRLGVSYVLGRARGWVSVPNHLKKTKMTFSS